VHVDQGAELLPYFDGDTPDLNPVEQFFWEFFPGASASVASSSIAPGAARGPWLLLPTTAVPGAGTPPLGFHPQLVLDYEEERVFNGSIHEVIGRNDRLSNPGPLMLRSGTLEAFALTYAKAVEIRDLFEAGLVALFIQPTYAGMDMYFQARSVRLTPDPAFTVVRRWLVVIAYDEVPAP
jgi:hypothetical protein